MSNTPLQVGITGTGHALPCKVVTSAELDGELRLDPGELERQTGVRARRFCTDESQIDLAVTAAKAAINHAAIDPTEIDLILSGAGVPYQSIPATAPLIMRSLGLPDGGAEAFDVNATCLSFVSALGLAAGRIALGQSRVALVVSSEVASRALPWDTAPDTAALFGDGAGAAILQASDPGRGAIHAQLMRTYPSGYEASALVSGGTRIDYHTDPDAFAANALFQMNGSALFKLTHRHFPGFVTELLDRAGWALTDVDLVVPHQASPRALDHMIAATGLGTDRVVTTARDLGNQIAASIPVALDIAHRDGRIAPGSRVLLLGTSAGVSFGGVALEF